MSTAVQLRYTKVVELRGAIKSTFTGFDVLSKFYLECQQYEGETILVSLKSVTFIDGNLCALLQAYMYRLGKERGLKFVFAENDIKSRFKVLARNGFFGEHYVLPDGYGTSIRLHVFKQDEDERFITYVTEQLLSHEALKLDNTKRDAIADHFCEIFANVQNHAQTHLPIFACGQYFPNLRQLKFSLLDLGVGYFTPIHQYTRGAISNCQEAIHWAVNGNSTKSLHLPNTPGGLGLKSIRKYCLENSGALHIASGDAYVVYCGREGSKAFQGEKFDGALINIIFNC